ncbi:hypothetical protein GCM10007854_26260 [Algimonas porphyrae]|uniref:Uncharacterized protein n=1 Tax=Algimonas porphyrae TaxID=1128113 RepID=A0ABQ5V296_9PROT|nr:hypothetical protein GCM10007854_26260 [Algimonas porphyrae]
MEVWVSVIPDVSAAKAIDESARGAAIKAALMRKVLIIPFVPK